MSGCVTFLSVPIVIGSILFLTGCTVSDEHTYSSCEKTELPVFLGEVWPAPAEVMSFEVYNRKKHAMSMSNSGVGVMVIPSRVDSAENLSRHKANTGHIYYAEKSVLYLDGNELPKRDIDDFYVGTGQMGGLALDEDENQLQYDAGPYYMTWLASLSPGTHSTIFNLTNKEGKLFEFSWCFTITEN